MPWSVLTLAGLLAGTLVAALPATALAPAGGCVPWRVAVSADVDGDGAGGDGLRQLAVALADARVVAVGESVHGSRSLHLRAQRLFDELVEVAGFTVFALEIDQAHAARLDAWVQGADAILGDLLAEHWYGSRIFYDRALVDLLHRLREANGARAAAGLPPLHVAGFDMKQPQLAARAAVAALRRVDRRAARQAGSLYASALEPGAFGLFPNVSGFTGVLPVKLPEGAVGAPLRIEVDAREADPDGGGVEYGEVGVFALGEVRRLTAAEIGPGWQTLVLDLRRPAGDEIRLRLFHRGNGTVELATPRITLDGTVLTPPDLDAVAPQPLLMPHLQRMDYRREVVALEGRRVLRVAADPVLGDSLQAAVAAEALVGATLPDDPWAQRSARLVSQAVQWRVLAEPNRDVFLAENLRWLADTAFPGARIVALTHAGHASRRPNRMGAFLAASLGDGYRAVTLEAVSGRYRYFGEVSQLQADSPLVLHEVTPQPQAPVDCVRRLAPGDEADAVVYVSNIEPID